MSAARRQPLSVIAPAIRLPHPAPASLPALAAALRHSDRRHDLPTPWAAHLRYDPLVPMYRILHGTPENEASAAAHVLLAVADRLRRLASAYAEWQTFDAPAFFDLSLDQTARLVHVVERVATVHVVFFADQLLPAFAQAAAYWQQEFRPGYWDLQQHLHDGHPVAPSPEFATACLPCMVAAWQRAETTLRQTRALLDDEIGFWAANGADEERGRHRLAWQQSAAPGLDPALLPDLAHIPTLTLAVDFPLPAARQPGRRRRLQRLQLRRSLRRLRARSA